MAPSAGRSRTQRRSAASAARSTGPRRTCVGCGREAGKDELLRFALAGGSRLAVLDADGRLGGRGAYLCRSGVERPRPECLAQALRRNGFSRTLRASVSLDPKLVESVGR